MPFDITAEKQQLHALVDKLPDDQLASALQYLNFLCADPVLLSLLNAPADDEPYTEAQRKRDDHAEASIARREGVSHDAILCEFEL